jgi:3-phosphoshikimate 1-carboxyvinyltransferase
MNWRLRASSLAGSLSVPGDKSIAHRALMLGSLARGTSEIRGLPEGEDVRATADCVGSLGATVRIMGTTAVVVSPGQLGAPDADLYAANSGTTMRLLAGILAGQPFSARLTGDSSLSHRPMQRVIEPLTRMGADIRSRDGCAPLQVTGRPLHGIHYSLPVASAQVKSAVLLAGLFADGETSVSEPTTTRDHTERMLRSLDITVEQQNGSITLRGGQRPRPFDCDVPGDVSSAAFFFAAAVLSEGAIQVRRVGVNPTRTAFFGVLERMGARVKVENIGESMGEPVADVTVTGEIAKPIEIQEGEAAALIDELPLVALLATRACGTSTIRGAAELRVKESDRIWAVASVLGAMGADLEELPDGFVVRGPTQLRGATVSAHDDHRVAMMAAIAGGVADGETVVTGAEAAAVSFSGFASCFRQVGGRIDVA